VCDQPNDREHEAKGTNPGEVDDDVEVADEPLLDAGRGGGGRPEQEAAAVLRVDEGLGVDGAEEARLVLLQRLPRAVVRVRALPRLQDAALAALLLLVLLLVARVAAPAGGGGRRVEAAPAAADAVHGAGGGGATAAARSRSGNWRRGRDQEQEMGQGRVLLVWGSWALLWFSRAKPLLPPFDFSIFFRKKK
jgi:hypothetical protein